VGIANLETSLRNTAVSGGSIAWLKVYVFELYAALNISEALRFERTVGGAAPNQAYQNSECRNKQATQISDYDAATTRISAVRASLVLRENRFPLSVSLCSTSPATASKPPRTSWRRDSSRRPVSLLGACRLMRPHSHEHRAGSGESKRLKITEMRLRSDKASLRRRGRVTLKHVTNRGPLRGALVCTRTRK